MNDVVTVPSTILPGCHNKSKATYGSSRRVKCSVETCPYRSQCYFANNDVYVED